MDNAEQIYKPGSLLKAGDVAKLLNVSRTTAYKLMRESIPVLKLGPGIVRVKIDDLESFIDSSRDVHLEVD